MKNIRDEQIVRCDITVFTPTFNRRHSIGEVYECLKNQTHKNFEWLVIDDGSSDGTRELFENEILPNCNFTVRYYFQENLGKHMAHNKAIQLARGELFLPLDSDDTCVNTTLEVLWNAWSSIENKGEYSGIGCLCINPETGNYVGKPFPSNYMISNDLEIYFKYKCSGEKWGCIRTDILKLFPFPKIEGARFCPENVVWFKIAERYKKLYINEGLRHYVIHGDSLSHKNNIVTFDFARNYEKIFMLNNYAGWYFRYLQVDLIRMTLSLIRGYGKNNKAIIFGHNALIKQFEKIFIKVIIAVCAPTKYILKLI